MIIYSRCKSTKKISFTLRFLMFFLRQLVSQIFMFPLLPNAVYIGVREIRHTGKVTSRFAHNCPSLWASLPNYVGHLYPRLWARLPKTMGIRTRVRGYGYPCTWV